MRVSIVAGLIVAVHVAVIGSVVMTQGCASTQRDAGRAQPAVVEMAPAPVLPPSATVVAPQTMPPVTFPEIKPPVKPAPLKTDVAAENVYVIKAGDSLSKIAVKHSVNVQELAELNQISDPNKIRIGQKLILPDYAKPSQSQPSATPAAAKSTATTTGDAYVIKAGDSLSKIASAHGVKMKDLAAANQITDYNKIRIGQKLAIPSRAAKAAGAKAETPKTTATAGVEPKVDSSATPVVAPGSLGPRLESDEVSADEQEDMLAYTVQDGDTVESIARLFVVRQEEIRRVNNLVPGQDVTPQQRIRIPPAPSL